MKARAKQWSGVTSGANVRRKFAWVCKSCGFQPQATRKPARCLACGCSDWLTMDSKAEAKRWHELRLLQRTGQIADLEHQVPFELLAPGASGTAKVGTYIADFRYRRLIDGRVIVEDVKGEADTTLSVWKRRHVAAQYGFDVVIVRR